MEPAPIVLYRCTRCAAVFIDPHNQAVSIVVSNNTDTSDLHVVTTHYEVRVSVDGYIIATGELCSGEVVKISRTVDTER